jgi:hypothetical protein
MVVLFMNDELERMFEKGVLILPRYSPEVYKSAGEKPQRNSVRIACVPSQTQTDHHPNIN